MKPAAPYTLRQERLSAERQQAVIRLLLALVTSLVLIKFYSSQVIPGYDESLGTLFPPNYEVPRLGLGQVIFVVSLLAAYSGSMWVLLRCCPDRLNSITAAGTIIEFTIITYLFATTLWTGVPFYLWYFFFVVSVASRYGWLHSILALSASIVSFTWVMCANQRTADDVVMVLGFTGFLLVLAMMFGQISEKQLNYQARLAVVNDFRAELASVATPRDVIHLLIERTQQLLNVEQAFFLPAKRGVDGSDAPGLRSVGRNPVLLSTFREEGGIWNVEQILTEEKPLVSNRLSKHHALPPGLAAKLGLRNIAAAPMMVRGQPVGVIYATNRRDKALHNADMQMLELLATQTAPVLENALLWERLTEAATSEERLRIARDLHDNFLQTLAAIKLHLERCKILVTKDSDRARDGIDKIHQIATRGLAEVRYYLSELRVMGPEPSRFQEAIRKCAEEASLRGGFEVNTEISLADTPVPPGVAVAAFQIVRELLNNATAHSRAKHVKVEVRVEDDRLCLSVEDDGVGFEVQKVRELRAAQGHLGLVGIEERARQCGGTLTIESTTGKGTRALACLIV